jgi:hypothetical protein
MIENNSVDNKANFRYPDDYRFRFIGVTEFWTAVKAGTQFEVFS